MGILIKFEKVSFEQYCKDRRSIAPLLRESVLRNEWDNIKLPTRATYGSSGYDFYAPYDVGWIQNSLDNPIIYTGVRFIVDEAVMWVLLMPRSGWGFKYGFRLVNTIGNIDGDYANAENEGHIAVKVSSIFPVPINRGDRFMQGVICPCILTTDDCAAGLRTGGFGSTGIC